MGGACDGGAHYDESQRGRSAGGDPGGGGAALGVLFRHLVIP